MMQFSKEFLEKYSAANYVAILAASEEAYRTGWIAPDKDEDPREHVSANTAATTAGSSADTAAREQTTVGESAANNNSESNQSAPAEHAVLEPDRQQSQSRTVPAEGPQSQRQDSEIGHIAHSIATEQVQKECGISAAPTDTGYRHLYDLEVERRAQQIAKNLRRRQTQRENRRTTRSSSKK